MYFKIEENVVKEYPKKVGVGLKQIQKELKISLVESTKTEVLHLTTVRE